MNNIAYGRIFWIRESSRDGSPLLLSRFLNFKFLAFPPAAGQPPENPPPAGEVSAWGNKSFSSLFSRPAVDEVLPIKPVASFKGDPALFFSADEVRALAKPFDLALVGKFSYGRPSMAALRKEFHTIKGAFTIGWLDLRHVLIRFTVEEDYVRLWMKGNWNLLGFPMRVFKWTPEFQISAEPSLVPIWVSFENLPIHLFRLAFLLS